MKTRLEHANMHVQDVDKMLDFIQSAFPDFAIRYDSGSQDPERWVHIGNDWEFVQYYTDDRSQRNDYMQEMAAGLIDR